MSTPTTTDDLIRELDILEARLADGEKRIAEAKQASIDTTDWEAFWNELLHSYEAVYRRLHVNEDTPPYDAEERVLRSLSVDPFPAEEGLTQTD